MGLDLLNNDPNLPIVLQQPKHHHRSPPLIYSFHFSNNIKTIINTSFRLLACRSNSVIDSLPVLPVLQMDLKVAHRSLWARRIQLPWTIVTSYPWQEHPFDALRRGLAGWRRLAGSTSSGVHSRVFHRALEVIRRVLCQKAAKPFS